MSPIERFLETTPRVYLVGGVLLAGVLYAMISSPPHSICDSQLESYKKEMVSIVFPLPTKQTVLPPAIRKAKESCQYGNSPGSCYEYITYLKKIASGLEGARKECAPQALQIEEVRGALVSGLDIMTRLAWGEKPPEMDTKEKLGWFQEAELSTFCKIVRVLASGLPEEEYLGLRRAVFSHLPGKDMKEILAREQEIKQAQIAAQVGAAAGSKLEDQVARETQSASPLGEGAAHPLFVPATSVFSEGEITARSLFAIRCQDYF